MAEKRLARVLAVADRAFSSKLIEWFGGAGWSHFANVMADGSYIDARDDWVKVKGHQAIPPGVQRRPAEYLVHKPKWIMLEFRHAAHYERWRSVLISQLGKPYDELAIWHFLTGKAYDRNWRNEDAWFCSELGVWALERAGLCPEVPTPIYRITPGGALLLSIGLGATVVAHRG